MLPRPQISVGIVRVNTFSQQRLYTGPAATARCTHERVHTAVVDMEWVCTCLQQNLQPDSSRVQSRFVTRGER